MPIAPHVLDGHPSPPEDLSKNERFEQWASWTRHTGLGNPSEQINIPLQFNIVVALVVVHHHTPLWSGPSSQVRHAAVLYSLVTLFGS